MRKALVLLSVLLVVSCAKDEFSTPTSVPLAQFQQIDRIESAEDVFDFLVTHHPLYTTDGIADLKTMLQEPAKTQFQRSGNTVELAGGSVDGLQAAIDEAGDGGTVIIKAGSHTETGLVTANHEIHLVGEPGALLTFANDLVSTLGVIFSAGLHLNHASRSTIRDLAIAGQEGGSGGCLLIEESHNVSISNASFNNFQYAITVEESNNTRISNTAIHSFAGWLDGSVPGSLGITVVNGRGSRIVNNVISNSQFGIWMCDRGGVSWGNETYGNFYGQILCNVPAGSFTTRFARHTILGTIHNSVPYIYSFRPSQKPPVGSTL